MIDNVNVVHVIDGERHGCDHWQCDEFGWSRVHMRNVPYRYGAFEDAPMSSGVGFHRVPVKFHENQSTEVFLDNNRCKTASDMCSWTGITYFPTDKELLPLREHLASEYFDVSINVSFNAVRHHGIGDEEDLPKTEL